MKQVKDRNVQYPRRYTLTQVETGVVLGTFDFNPVTGEVIEAGTPINSELFKSIADSIEVNGTVIKLKDVDGNDLSVQVMYTINQEQTNSTTNIPSTKLLKDSSFARVYRHFTELDLDVTFTPEQLFEAMVGNSTVILDVTAENTGLSLPFPGYGLLTATRAYSAARCSAEFIAKVPNSTALYRYSGTYRTNDTSNKWSGWKQIIDDSSAQTITGVKTHTASPIVPTTPSGPSAAVAKSYVDGLSTPYDKVIRTQTEFEELISSPNWLDAVSVALVGQFTLSTANNSGIKVPATVKQIHGFNSAKITITNFLFNPSTSNAGLWYNARPTTLDYSIRDLEVDCTGIGSVELGFGFRRCSNLTNCTGTGTGPYGYGFRDCTNLTNCTGTGTGANGYGFYNITYASNCKDGGSTTAMWGGDNYNIDIDTCCKTPVTANKTTLNT